MTKIKDSNVLITGGASGIGRIMGRIALERGAKRLVIWDINEANIANTIEELKGLGKVAGYKVDVSDSKQVAEVAAKVGFKDPLYFSKAFKKSFGMSPIKFRREKGIMAPKRSVSSGCD